MLQITKSEIVQFTADDGFPLSFERFRPAGGARPVPVIVVHGAGTGRLHIVISRRSCFDSGGVGRRRMSSW